MTAFCCGSIRSSVPVEATHPAPSVTAIRLRRGASALLRLGKARARWTYPSPQVIRPRGSVRRTRRPDEPSVGHRSQGRGNPDALVFSAPFGGPLHLTNFRSRVWVTARQKSVRLRRGSGQHLLSREARHHGLDRRVAGKGVSVGTRATAGSRTGWTTPCPPRDQCGATGDLIVPLRTPRRSRTAVLVVPPGVSGFTT
jgi:hypothetical protein